MYSTVQCVLLRPRDHFECMWLTEKEPKYHDLARDVFQLMEPGREGRCWVGYSDLQQTYRIQLLHVGQAHTGPKNEITVRFFYLRWSLFYF